MAEIINLNKARKQRAKTAAAAKAVENRAKFGRSKLQKLEDAARSAQIDRILDDAKRED